MSGEAQQIVHQLREDGLSDEEVIWYAVNVHDAEEAEIRSELQRQRAPEEDSAVGQSAARGGLQSPSEWKMRGGDGPGIHAGVREGGRGRGAKAALSLLGVAAVLAVGGVLFHGYSLETLLGEDEPTGTSDGYVESGPPPLSADEGDDESAAMTRSAIHAWYWGFERNERGYRLIREAAEEGHAIARAQLAIPYWQGIGVERDRGRARELAREAIPALQRRAEAGEPHAQYLLGWYYERDGLVYEQDAEKAVEWYRRAATQGYAPAQVYLAGSYSFGSGVAEDPAQAAQWYRKAAEQGYAGAQYALGELYHAGRGVAHNTARAAEWYLKAADKGVPEAQSNLGYLYEEGDGVPQDYAEAIKWHRAVAEAGNPFSQNHLGELYEDEAIVTKDIDAAVTWYRKSARQGHRPAQENLRRLNLNW